MGKSHFRVGVTGKGRTALRRCLGCRRPLVWGERCPPCQRDLRQRQRRKPR